MNLKLYQGLARDTAIYSKGSKERDIDYVVLGLCGESGEVANKVKKISRDDNNEITSKIRQEIKKELGDVLWYLSNVAYEFDLLLDDIAEDNIKKLKSRKDRDVISGDGDNR